MKKNLTIQLKALILLGVFSINMVAGFACVTCIGTWLISHRPWKTTVSICQHVNESTLRRRSKGCKDNCCNEHVVRISQSDKVIPQSFGGLHLIIYSTLVSSYFNSDILHTSKALAQSKYFVRSHHPPIPDIRIVIQRFQI